MPEKTSKIFLSYSCADRDFALNLIRDLRAGGLDLRIDQRDIGTGQLWDRVVQDAIEACSVFLIVLSPDSVASENVMDEISIALDEKKKIFPVLHRACKLPMRLRRIQYADFTVGYNAGLAQLLQELDVKPPTAAVTSGSITSRGADPNNLRAPQPNETPASRFRKLEDLLQVAGCEACGEMSRIEAGSFEMGAADSEPEARDGEKPRHRVTLKAFEIGRTVVTQGQWKAVMGNNPSEYKDAGDAWPVEQVSWTDVQDFLRKLNQLTGKTYRLPSEAEWEYATRAGTSTAFWWGNSIHPKQANYDGGYTYNGGPKGENRERTVKADSFEANPWGLFNVHGNVWEWVQDSDHVNYNGAPSNGQAWEDNARTMRGLRGGAHCQRAPTPALGNACPALAGAGSPIQQLGLPYCQDSLGFGYVCSQALSDRRN